MTMRIMMTIKKFGLYQRERFPIVILVFSLIPAVLSSGVIMTPSPTIFQTLGALVASVAYLLHIRIVDEQRDFAHDNLHHITRPVQTGVILRTELRQIDLFAVAFLLVIAVAAGMYSFVIAVIMLAYSYLAGQEFFVGERIRQYFFIYNGVNLVQMLLMQVFVYSVFANTFLFNALILAHFAFTSVGTVIFEFVRKLKRPGDDGTGRDTYTWYMGFRNAHSVYVLLLLLNTFLFFWITTRISPHTAVWLLVAATLAAVALLPAVVHRIKKTHQTDQLMQLSFLMLYGTFNVIIYFLRLYA